MRRFVGSAGLALSLLLAAWLGHAEAQNRLRAQAFITQARLPQTSERALLQAARRGNARVLSENTDAPIPERRWTADLVLSFAQPLNDLEFHVLFYDVEDGSRRFIDEMTTFVSDRAQKTFVQRLRLPRAKFRANRRYQAVVTVRRMEVATVNFGLAGEVAERSGEVTFTDDEAN